MTTIRLSGNIDHQTSAEARGHLLAELRRGNILHIDLSGVTWIDSSGLAVLVEVYLAARTGGHRVDLVNVSSDIMKMVRLAHLEGIFALQGDAEERTIH